LQSIAEFIKTLINNSLFAIASEQLIIAKDFYNITLTIYKNGLYIKREKVIITLIIINAFIIILFIKKTL
jgi:hypothetical protein